MSQKGVSFRLNSHITSIAILIIAAIVYINYHLSNKILVGKIEEGAINQSNLILSKVSRITVGIEEIAKNVAFQALYYQKNNDLNFLLAKVLEINIILESIHVELLNEKGNFVKYSSNKPGQIISSPDSVLNEQYILKLKSGELPSNSGLWSVPFYCRNDHTHLLVSYKTPIYYPNSKLVAGVVSCEVSLRELNRLLSEIKIGESGYSFIIDKSGNYITHPNPKVESAAHKSTFERLTKSKFQEMENEFANGRGGSRGIRQYVVDQACWLYMAPLTNPNWSILIVIPEKELFKDIEVVFKRIILVSGIGIIVLFFINMFIFWQMLNPLARITQSIQEFSSGQGVEKNSKNEIRMLIESFEDWQVKYGLLISEQSKTATEKLEQNIKHKTDLSAAEVVDNLSKSIVIYEGEKKQEDDITLLALKYLGHKQKNQV